MRHESTSMPLGFLNRFARLKLNHVAPDAIIIILSVFFAASLREGYGSSSLSLTRHMIPLFVVLPMSLFVVMGAYDIMWRYISFNDGIQLLKAITISSLITDLVASRWLGSIPSSIFVIHFLLLSIGIIGVRLARRYLYEYSSRIRAKTHGRGTLIYGAGANGRTVADRLRNDHDHGCHPIGFIDDDPGKAGRSMGGLRVLGLGKDLDRLLALSGATELIVAIGRPSGELLRRILEVSARHKIRPRMIKKLADSRGSGQPTQVLGDIDLNDLLGRKKKDIDLSALKKYIPESTVLVTGAGGSIGSELARQIMALKPKRLCLLDHAEYQLYQIEKDLREAFHGTDIIMPLLVDIKNRKALEQVFFEHSPQIVFHAAAYKHVPLVEANPHSAILNNILGTKNLLDLAEEQGTESFILISTDKAVSPISVMGATKRFCELMVSERARRTGRRFASVRFGNVLGSSGSLIPLLKEQINSGKAITITHKDMRRYFMLIPEAVALVLKASAMAAPGDVMVLKMAESIRIVDIAKSLIALMGKNVDEIPFMYVGIRPGEKIEEQLFLTGSEIDTSDPDIMVIREGVVAESDFDVSSLRGITDDLIWSAYQGSSQAVEKLRRATSDEFNLLEDCDSYSESLAYPIAARDLRAELQ